MNIAEEWLSCNESNYKEFIYDSAKTLKLIKETGLGCQLQSANLNSAYLGSADLRDANLSNVYLRGLSSFGALIQRAILKEAKYNDDTNFNLGVDSWFFNPKERGMIYSL